MMPLKKQSSYSRSSESGYSLIEGLIAILIVSFLASAIAPMIAWTVGTRAQAKRIELAAQAGRSYLDFLKANPTVANFPGNTSLDAPEANQLNADCTSEDGYCNNNNQLFCVNFDENPGCQTDSLADMVVQPIILNGDATNGYALGLRVYRAYSFSSGVGALSTDRQTTSITTALGNVQAPLTTMTTEVLPDGAGFEALQQRLQ
ncbi:hormogonium polysaccharide secretion pseudopilin HpsB [Limnoraphis robusta]|nr:hormogonium polysaccharide secretion pseudopilin HpsB [Limnoraphis robusta]